VRETLQRIAEAWQESAVQRLLPPKHAAALREYWESSRLLRPYGQKLGAP
jgi:hypothetical protein